MELLGDSYINVAQLSEIEMQFRGYFNMTDRSDSSKISSSGNFDADIHDRASRIRAYTGIRQDIAELVPRNAKSILDVGCSNGALGGFLKSQFPTRRVVGIEIDSELANEATTNLDSVICSNLESLQISSALSQYSPFDCIICADVLEHLRIPEEILLALTRTLAPGGKLIVGLPNIRHHSALWEIFVRGSFPRRSRGIFDSTHLRWFTYADSLSMLRSASLEPELFKFSTRIGDKGGGLLNRLSGRFLDPIAHWPPIREFLVYQFAIRASSGNVLPED